MEDIKIYILEARKDLHVEHSFDTMVNCFKSNTVYYFIDAFEKNEIVAFNETGFPHFFEINDPFTREHFIIKDIRMMSDLNISEYRKKRIERLIEEIDYYYD